jgi:hypothetical protein
MEILKTDPGHLGTFPGQMPGRMSVAGPDCEKKRMLRFAGTTGFEKPILCPDRRYEATNAQNAQSPLLVVGRTCSAFLVPTHLSVFIWKCVATTLSYRMDARRSRGEGAFSRAFHRASLGRLQGSLRAPIVRSAAPCPSCIRPSASGCGTCWSSISAVFCDPLGFIVRVRQHGACISENNHQAMARSPRGLTSKIRLVAGTNGLPGLSRAHAR